MKDSPHGPCHLLHYHFGTVTLVPAPWLLISCFPTFCKKLLTRAFLLREVDVDAKDRSCQQEAQRWFQLLRTRALCRPCDEASRPFRAQIHLGMHDSLAPRETAPASSHKPHPQAADLYFHCCLASPGGRVSMSFSHPHFYKFPFSSFSHLGCCCVPGLCAQTGSRKMNKTWFSGPEQLTVI